MLHYGAPHDLHVVYFDELLEAAHKLINADVSSDAESAFIGILFEVVAFFLISRSFFIFAHVPLQEIAYRPKQLVEFGQRLHYNTAT